MKALLPALRRPRLRHDAAGRLPHVPLGARTPTRCSRASTSSRPGTAPRFADGRLAIAQYWDMAVRAGGALGGRVGRARPRRGPRRGAAPDGLRRPARELPQRRHRLERDRGGDEAATADRSRPTRSASARRTWPRDRSRRPRVRPADGQAASASTTTSRSSSPTSSTCCPKLVWHMDEPIADPAVHHDLPHLLGGAASG